ncbi:metal-dependent hydrolase [Vibrio agarivorans]|uniref:metal-dependent hydrolase n=1 Tax=Vibrio agarivorans TaxID=153622 RepID=UPI0025B50A3A|nr:metal-dependent hydrolase [Vibrio agarivorans]MDN3660385.1 metal-dependent hydrolase [Vibrio agarivorans]
MDPITQGVLGATLSQSVRDKRHVVVAGALGLLAGMSPDLDVLIRSSTDPLLFLEYHRQFSHSLIFIPFGSLLCALVFYPLFAKRCGLSFKASWLYCALGYSTHALLDACTSYGTQLLWPFTDERYAWNILSVVDPLYTLPLVVLILLATLKREPKLARVALVWVLIYPMFGMIQKERAENAGWELVKLRQHEPVQLEAKPSFGNLLVWKVVYETEDHYHVDAVRVGISMKTYSGDTINKLDINRDLAWLNSQSQQAEDLERFRHFSDGFLAQDPNNELRIFDVRYSMVPNQISPLWSITLSPNAEDNEHVEYATHRDGDTESRQVFLDMLLDRM